MTRFAWTLWLCVSMTAIGVVMFKHAHNPAYVLQFTGAWLVASGVLIPGIGVIVTWRQPK